MSADQRQIVLVVDDEAQLLKLSALLLTRQGYSVLTAASGEEAISISRSYPGHIHLLLSDIEMSGMNGIDLAQQIIAERPDTRVLLDSANLFLAEESGFSFLAKPFSAAEMRTAVANAIGLPSAAPIGELEPTPTGHATAVKSEVAPEAAPVSSLAADPRDAVEITTARPSHRWRLPRAVPVWAAAAGIILVATWWGLYEHPSQMPDTVQLHATRGAGGEVEVEARRPLVLNLDPSGLPPFDSYKIEVADGAGHIVWRKAVPAQGPVIAAESAGLQPGIYFVRLYSPASELLREYGLRVGKKH